MTKKKSISNKKGFEFLIAQSSLVYLSSKIICNIISFFAFALLARKVSPEVFGSIDIYLTAAIFLVNLSVFGQDQALGRLINDPISSKEKLKLSIHSYLIQIVFSIIIILVICIIFNFLYFFNSSTVINHPRTAIYLLLAQVPFQVLTIASLGIFQWSINRRSYLILSITSTLLPAISLLICIVFTNSNITKVLISYLISRFIVSFVAIYLAADRKLITWLPKIDIDLCKKLFLFAFPLGLVVSLQTFSPFLERIFVNSFLNSFELGQFALSAKICSILNIFGAAFSIAFGPYSLKFFKDPESKKSFKLIFKFIVLTSCYSIIFLTCFSSDIIGLFGGSKYMSAIYLILPLSLSTCIQIVSNITGIGLFIKKRNIYYFIFSLLNIFIFVLLFQSSYRYLGLLAVGWSILIAEFLKAVFQTIISNKFFFIEWPFKSLALTLLITLITSMFFTHYNYPGNILLKSFFFVLTLSIVSLSAYFSLNRMEKQKLGSFITNLGK